MFDTDLPQRRHHYTLFCTDPSTLPSPPQARKEKPLSVISERIRDMHYVGEHQNIEYRRFEEKDLHAALGPVAEREKVVAYVCGPPSMTDWAVGVLKGAIGMDESRVLCEKWW